MTGEILEAHRGSVSLLQFARLTCGRVGQTAPLPWLCAACIFTAILENISLAELGPRGRRRETGGRSSSQQESSGGFLEEDMTVQGVREGRSSP